MLRRSLHRTATVLSAAGFAPVTTSSGTPTRSLWSVPTPALRQRSSPQRSSAFGAPPAARAAAARMNRDDRGGGPLSSSRLRQQQQEQRASDWHQFTAVMHELHLALWGRPDRGSGKPAETVKRAETDHADGGSGGLDWVDPAVAAGDAGLLAALGVTDMEAAFASAGGRDAEGDDDGPLPSPISTSATTKRFGVVALSPRQARSIRPLVALACRRGLHAGVAPVVIVQRILEAVMYDDAVVERRSGGAAARVEEKERILPYFLPQGEGGEGEVLRRQQRALSLFDDPSVTALLAGEARRLGSQVEWALQRLRDSRSPAAAAAFKAAAEEDGPSAAAEVVSRCGEPVALQYQLLREHAHAEQLLSFFRPRILREISAAAVGANVKSAEEKVLPRLATLEAGLQLCAALQGGQGAQRAVRWAHGALSSIESLVRQQQQQQQQQCEEVGEDAEDDSGHGPAAVEPSAMLDLARGRLASCCRLALQAAANGEGAGAAAAAAAATDGLSFEGSYALMMRYMSVLQQAADLAAAAADGNEDPSSAPLQASDITSGTSLQDTLSTFADVTLQLYAPLAENLALRGHSQHYASMRSLLTTLLTDTDVGYDAESMLAVQQGYCALLHALATIKMDERSRHSALEDLWRTVMQNSRSDVWQADAVNVQVLAVLSACSSSSVHTTAAAVAPAGAAEAEAEAPTAAHVNAAEREEEALRQQRALSVFNILMEPSSRELAFRESVLGPMSLCAPLPRADDDVRRLLSYIAQRYPISMDTAHAAVAKLLLKDELIMLGTSGGGEAAATSSAAIYLLLDQAVAVQRRQRDVQAARTFFLRLLTFHRDVARVAAGGASPLPAETEEEAMRQRDAHMAATLSGWCADMDAQGVRTLPVTIIELLAATAALLQQTFPDTLPQTQTRLREEMRSRAQGLLSLPPLLPPVTPEKGKAKLSPDKPIGSVTLVDDSDGGVSTTDMARRPLLTFPLRFSVAGCAGTSSPWSDADAHAFLADVRRLLRETNGLLRLRDYCTLDKLNRRCQRHGLPYVSFASDEVFECCVVPPWGAGGSGDGEDVSGKAGPTTAVESALGTVIPVAVSLDADLAGGTAAAATGSNSVVERWLGKMQMDLAPAEGDATLGGGNAGLSTRPFYPSYFEKVLLPSYQREKRSRRAQRVSLQQQQQAGGSQPTTTASSSAAMERGIVDEVFVTVHAEPPSRGALS